MRHWVPAFAGTTTVRAQAGTQRLSLERATGSPPSRGRRRFEQQAGTQRLSLERATGSPPSRGRRRLDHDEDSAPHGTRSCIA